jgi:dihydroflavonol-4-reductase
MAGKVMVSGGSGYIAGYLIRQLIEQGWAVNTTIRSLSKEATVRDLLAVDSSKLSFFAADLNRDDGWAEAMAGCSHVAHVASPFPAAKPKTDDELIIPARDGALRALRAAKAAGVTRVVMTSSVAAIAYGHGQKVQSFTEADWTNVDSPDAYAYVKSKTIAERAARDWVTAEGGAMEFATINPALVLGPILNADFSTSVEVIKKLMNGSMPGCPDLSFGIVDVRDVADLHIRALNAPNINGERFIASGRSVKMLEVAQVLKAGLGAGARKVPTRSLPDFLVKVSALFDPAVKQVLGELGCVRNASSAHAKAVLGWEPRPIEDSIVDTGHSLIEQGVVKV